MNNIVFANFECNETNKIVSQKVWQWNYGQILRIQGLDLPDAVEIHFSLQESGGTAVRRIGVTKDGVTDVVIPDFILENEGIERDYTAYAFIYLSTEESGQTEHRIELNIKSRPEPEGSTGSNETSFGAIMDALKTFAAGKADGLKYENSILKLMSGEAELARVTIKAGEGTGSDAREIELQKSDTAIQWRYVGDEEWTDLVLLEELKGEKGDPGEGGKTAYQYAQDGGYTGTEEEFAKKLAQENPTREEFSQLSEQKVNLPVDEDGKPLTPTEGQTLLFRADGTTYYGTPTTSGGGDSGGGDTGTTTHGIVWDLVNVTSSNAVTSVNDGALFVAVLTPSDGYTLGDVTVTMGGEALTGVWNADTSTVAIASVTGDVIISCVGNAQPTTEILSTFKWREYGWPTYTDNGNGSYTFDLTGGKKVYEDLPSSGSYAYWTMIYPGNNKGGQLTIKFNKAVTSGGISVCVYAVNKEVTLAYQATNALVWSTDLSNANTKSISEDTTLDIPEGLYPFIIIRNESFIMEGDEASSNVNTATYIKNGDITFEVSGTSETQTVETLSVDDDYAQDYGIATTSLVTDNASTTGTGIDSVFASVIEEVKNAWMIECNGDIDKIPLIIHTDQHSHLSDSGNKMLFEYISEIVNWYEISKIVNLGDTANVWADADTEHPLTESTALEGYLEAMKPVPYSKRIEVFGNHDTWQSADSGGYIGLTPQGYLHKYFKNIYARQKDNYGNFVVKDDYYNVKYVVVSGFAYDSALGGYSHYVIPSDSIDWIISELEKADGYDVIILSHVPLGTDTNTIYNPIDGTYTSGSVDGVNYKLLTDLWSGRKSKTSGSVTDEYGVAHEFDFTGCDGELLCGLHGHMHDDGYYYIGELLDAYFDAFYVSPNAFYFVLVDRANSQLNVWKVDNTPQYQNYQIPFNKPEEETTE